MSALLNDQEHDSIMSARAQLAILLVAAGLIGLYTLLRYGGHWGEGDTSTFTRAIRSVADTGRIAPDDRFVYGSGYNYPSLVVFLMHLCRINLSDVQIYAAPLLVVWLVIPAWLAYREITGSTRGATLATAILIIQPELLFAVLRGTHEKFTRGMMLLCLFLLFRSLRIPHHPARFTALVITFYLMGYAIITSNNLMATSFTVAIGLALVLIWMVSRREQVTARLSKPTLTRLGYVVATLLVLAFLFIFYAYTPAHHSLLMMESIWERVLSMLLNVEAERTNPYTIMGNLWINPAVYMLVSLANWLLLGSTALLWMGQSFQWLLRGKGPATTHELLLWAFYGAFAFQGALSVGIDISGALAANLQHRIFPSFAMLAAPIAARAIIDWRPTNLRIGRLANAGLALVFGFLTIMSVLKATNEPMVSNKWLFYVPGELQAVAWSEEHLIYRTLWTEFDERIFAAVRVGNGASDIQLNIIPNLETNIVRDFLISDVTRWRSERTGDIIPIEADSLITYDNGQAQIYHLRPQTPYQP
ncbi:hypothetical protein [Candidatus Chloroploca sp. Khr17]|uniref:hypothetical protein n=1 Tax=Candidatus Chloroploca sp. Khr17 TaxID=2496869 RepID=UPI00101C63D0|nr:hypothetical protein [Candidatus Chloroploca sp. Khr17]